MPVIDVGGYFTVKRGPEDMHCTRKARRARAQPMPLIFEAATAHQTVDGAADKLDRLAEPSLEKIS